MATTNPVGTPACNAKLRARNLLTRVTCAKCGLGPCIDSAEFLQSEKWPMTASSAQYNAVAKRLGAKEVFMGQLMQTFEYTMDLFSAVADRLDELSKTPAEPTGQPQRTLIGWSTPDDADRARRDVGAQTGAGVMKMYLSPIRVGHYTKPIYSE